MPSSSFRAALYALNPKKGILFRHSWISALFISFLFQGCAHYAQTPQSAPQSRTTPPTITHSYMVGKGYYGDVLRIYIEADDPDHDMLRIATVVDQVGYGHYPTDWIYLKPQYKGHFVGYLQWNTFSSHGSYIHEWTQITIKVSVEDRAGNESNVVVLPFVFESGVARYSTPPAPFDQGNIPRLGYVDINLFNPRQDDTSDRVL